MKKKSENAFMDVNYQAKPCYFLQAKAHPSHTDQISRAVIVFVSCLLSAKRNSLKMSILHKDHKFKKKKNTHSIFLIIFRPAEIS